MKIKFGSFEFEVDNPYEILPIVGLIVLGLVAIFGVK